MELKKIFFPIGGGEELRERIQGALLVNKFFGVHMNIISCQLDPQKIYNVRMNLKGGVLFDEFLKSANDELKAQRDEVENIFEEECKKLNVSITQDLGIKNSAFLRHLIGIRSE